MRYLGIDYGEKRVGLAVSDEELKLAFPLSVLDNSQGLIKEIIDVCKTNSVEKIIVGESKDFSGKENKIMEEIKPFVEKLKKATLVSVETHPEFLTSFAAERFQGKNNMHDASAAALILQSFLDTLKNSKQ